MSLMCETAINSDTILSVSELFFFPAFTYVSFVKTFVLSNCLDYLSHKPIKL